MHSPKKHIETFLTNTRAHPVIVIFGPTGSGKTVLSIKIAQHIGGEIVSVDARQIYRQMNIGTGKITPDEMNGVTHHMLDICDPSESFSVVNYRHIALPLLSEIWERGRIPILCGGTGLYLDSLLFDRDYMGDAPDQKRRDELEAWRKEHGNMALWQMLYDIDPEYAQKLHPNNTTYIIRAIEVFRSTGRSKQEAKNTQTLRFPTCFLTPYVDNLTNRKQLYNNINIRVNYMVENGLIQEVQNLIDQYGCHAPGLNTIGYREIVSFLSGHITQSDAINLIQQHSRQYAKRQITWNKKYEQYHPHYTSPSV